MFAMYNTKNLFVKLASKYNKQMLLYLLVFIIFVLVGIYYVHHTWNTSINNNSKMAQESAQSAEAAFSKDEMKKLSAVGSDINKTEYEHVKNHLMKIVSVNKDVRFAYIFVKRNDKIYFLADS